MKVAVFSARPYDREFLDRANDPSQHQLTYFEARLSTQTALLCEGHEAVCAFINDDLSAEVLEAIADFGIHTIALRSAGFNHVDLAVAQAKQMKVVRVPAYSPYAVAEHAVALILALNRKIYRAYNRVRDDNFMLDGLMGFDLYGSTVGIVGTGRLGSALLKLCKDLGVSSWLTISPKMQPVLIWECDMWIYQSCSRPHKLFHCTVR